VEVSELEARERNLELVAQLEAGGSLQEGPVADAFRAVLRHHFLRGRLLAEVYEDTALPTKVDEQGVPVRSSSQPAIMALMLEQLQCRPGQAVLEIGAGTGYNVALLWHLVTPGGW
jgi:protein-L-isoaspartate(D-aspartate) O-methyltransferase